MTFRIAQISDTHLSGTRPFFVDQFVRVGEGLRSAKPDLVLNSGDITLDGANHDGDLAAARRLHEGLGLPLRYLPGNHDLGNSQDCPGHGTIDTARRNRYVAEFGPDWWSFDVPGWRVLGINAQLLGSDLVEVFEQEAAIAEAVSGLGTRRLALVLHKPLCDRSVDETEMTVRFLNPAARHALIERLDGVVPALVISGHVHQYRCTEIGGARHVWGPSTAFILPERIQPVYGLKQAGYVEHTLEADGSHDSRLVQPPGLATLNIMDFPKIY